MKIIFIMISLVFSLKTIASEFNKERIKCVGPGFDFILVQEEAARNQPFPSFKKEYRANLKGLVNELEVEYLPIAVTEFYTGRAFDFKFQPIWHGHFNHFFRLHLNIHESSRVHLSTQDLEGNFVFHEQIFCHML